MTQITADILLLLVTLVWGTTFVVVKNAIETMGPLTYLAVRFSLAGIVLLAWHFAKYGFRPKRDHNGSAGTASTLRPGEASHAWYSSSRRFYTGGILTGLALAFSYATQTLGLVTVAAGKAAFITGLSVVLVPLGARLILRHTPDVASVIGVSLATVGLGLMSIQLPLNIALGDLLVLLCAVGFATHILLVGAYSSEGDPVLFAGIQLVVVAVGTGICALIFERPIVVPSSAWGAIVFTALAATSAAFLIQSAVQRYTSATHTALIFSVEPVFGAVSAWLLAGEVMTGREIVGAVSILVGMLVSELGSAKKTDPVPLGAED
jgi:drug/metabolite transporter (DMT)-like permease